MADVKLVLIGAGSASFTAGLVADVLTGLSGEVEVGLVDIDERALGVAEGLTRRMVEARDASVTISASTDRRDVLPGADFVVTTIGVGGRRAWEADVFIPRKHGVFQPVGDTVMAGGISRALRQVPPMLDIANDVHRLCPNAHFFNYANPMAALCRAVNKATPAKVTGLCHGVQGTVRYLAEVAGVPWQEVGALYLGMNHLTFITHLTHGGKSLWPAIDAQMESREDNPFSWDLYRAHGAFPAVLDRHVAEFFPECFPGGAYCGKTLGVDIIEFEPVVQGGDAHFERMAAQADGRLPLDEGIFDRVLGEHEALIDIIRSIRADAQALFPMNTPNTTVAGVPAGFVLEMPTAATAAGCVPLAMPEPGPGVLAMVTEALYGVEITVEAALTGSRELFVQALLYDRCVTDVRRAGALADELLAAHREHLPQFA
jgi:alpha-galactosidase